MVTIDLAPEVEARLKREAAVRGITLSKLISQLIENALRSPSDPPPSTGDYLLQIADEARAYVPDAELRKLPPDWAKNKNKFRLQSGSI